MEYRAARRIVRHALAAGIFASLLQTLARADTPASWLSAASGNWTDPTQWSTNPAYPNNTPAASYQATIDAAGAYTVSLNSDISVNSVLLNSPNATLSQTAGTLTTPSLTIQAGTFQFGGTLSNTTLSVTGGTLNIANGVLDNGALGSDINYSLGPPLYLNASLNGNGHVVGVHQGYLFLAGDATVTDVQIGLGLNGIVGTIDGLGHSLMIASNAIVQGVGRIDYSPVPGDNVVNNGDINANAGSSLTLSPVSLVNNGTMEANNGGTLDLRSVGTLDNSTGLIAANGTGSRVYVGGTYTSSNAISMIGNISANGGAIYFAGTIVGTGSGPLTALPAVQFAGATLNDITLGADLTVTVASSQIMTLQTALSGPGHAIAFIPASFFTDIELSSDFTLNSGAQMTCQLGIGIVGNQHSFTIAPGAVLNSVGNVSASVQDLTNFTNLGTMNNASLSITPTSLAPINQGTFEATNGGLVEINTHSVFTNNGVLFADVNSKMSISNGLIMDNGSSITITLGSNRQSGVLTVLGNLDLSLVESLNLLLPGGTFSGPYTAITYTGTLTGVFDAVTPGYGIDYSQPGKIIVLPEPASVAFYTLGVLLVYPRRARQRRKSLS